MTRIAKIAGVAAIALMSATSAFAATLSPDASIDFSDRTARPSNGSGSFSASAGTTDAGTTTVTINSDNAIWGGAGANPAGTVLNWADYVTVPVSHYLSIHQTDGGTTYLNLTSFDSVTYNIGAAKNITLSAIGYLHSSTGAFDDTVATLTWSTSATYNSNTHAYTYNASGTVSTDGTAYNPPGSGVPEPISMALVGAGLLTLGAARARRSARRS